MGWWSTDKHGHSFAKDADDPEMVWGDGPADILDAALAKIIGEFQTDWGRKPTISELRAGLEFSAHVALDDTPDLQCQTESV